MGTKLFEVTESFHIRSRGTLLIGPYHDQQIKVGDVVELRRPNGTSITTTVKGIERLLPVPAIPRTTIAIMVADVLVEDEVPVGTEV